MLILGSRRLLDAALFTLLVFSVLWRGGKALDLVFALALVSLCIGIASLFVRSKDSDAQPSALSWIFACSFLLLTILSFIVSSTQNYGFDEVLQSTSLFLVFRYALTVAPSRWHGFASRFARVISFATLLACAVGLIVYIAQPVNRFVGTFFDHRFHTDYWPNAWGEYLLLAWPLLFWFLYRRGVSVKKVMLSHLVMGLVLGCLFLSYSRGSLLAGVSQMLTLAFFFWYFHRSQIHYGSIARSAASIALVACIVFFSVNRVRSNLHPVQSVVEKVTFSASEGVSSISERRQFWSQALTLASEKPLLGYGPYSFRFVQPSLQSDILSTSDHPHNVFLKFAMERGVFTSILFAALVVWSLLSGLRLARHDELSLFLSISLLGVLVHSLIDYNLQFVGIALPFWIILGLLAPRSVSRASPLFILRIERISVLLLSSVLLFVAVYEAWFLVLAHDARKAERSSRYVEALHFYDQTDPSLFPRDGWLARAGMQLHLKETDAAMQSIQRGMSLNIFDARLWRLQGDALHEKGDLAAALRSYEEAYRLARYNDLSILRSLIEVQQGTAELRKKRHEYELLLNDYALAIQMNTHFIDLSPAPEELVNISHLLSIAFPSEREQYQDLGRRSMDHALEERSKLSGRASGLIW